MVPPIGVIEISDPRFGPPPPSGQTRVVAFLQVLHQDRAVTLEVWTARISSKDPDAFDVTRKTGAKAFAPSWAILGPALERRRAGREATPEEWKAYAAAYYDEMRHSRQAEPEAWAELLARPRVVLTCYCTRPSRCHRTLLARLLEKLGAKFEGEITDRDEGQQDLFKLAMSLDD